MKALDRLDGGSRVAGRKRKPLPGRPLLLALACSALLGAEPVGAATFDWLGGVGDWDDAAGWSLLGVPGAGDWARIHWGSVSLTAKRSVDQFTFSGGVLRGVGSPSSSGLTEFTGGAIGGFDGIVAGNGGLATSGSDSKALGNSGGGVSRPLFAS